VLARQSAGKPVDEQIISANIDTAFIVQAISNNFNINRLERYLTICYNSGIEPVLVLTKTDLVTEQQIQDALSSLNRRNREIKYFLLSNKTLQGLDRILEFIEKGRTYCVIGSSGVGKSTLINNLAGRELLRTGEISHSTNKGRHVTEHRELFVLDNGGIIIDNPGMKELGMTEVSEGIKTTFGDITEFASKCRYPDCRHVKESGCAVIDAVNKGLIDQESYSNYLKMVREKERYETTISEKRKKDKIFGKILKRYKKENF
jgi:ribosome biogenesis GTPase